MMLEMIDAAAPDSGTRATAVGISRVGGIPWPPFAAPSGGVHAHDGEGIGDPEPARLPTACGEVWRWGLAHQENIGDEPALKRYSDRRDLEGLVGLPPNPPDERESGERIRPPKSK